MRIEGRNSISCCKTTLSEKNGCSVAVSFLCTRVTKAMAEDERKLDRVMKYLNGTKTLGMCLGGSEPLQVTAYMHLMGCM